MATQELGVSSVRSTQRAGQAGGRHRRSGRQPYPLRRQGRNYVGLCPWHDDTRPSLQVNPERQSFKCWVCDIGGDVFSFVMKIEGVEFREALQMLADRAGIASKNRGRRRRWFPRARPQCGGGASQLPAAGRQHGKRTLVAGDGLGRKAISPVPVELPEAEPARRYLQERGITAESIERFHLGFSPLRARLDSSAGPKARRRPEKHGSAGRRFSEPIGILARPADGGGYYDRFRGRVLFSIHDAQGRPVGIGGRVLPELGSRARQNTSIRPRRRCSPRASCSTGSTWPASRCGKRNRTALVMEGYTDVIVAHQFGFQNAMAVLGTALGESHIKILKRHVDRIILVLDGDEAGTKRANEVLELFVAEQADLRILTLPENLDPCDYLHKYGAAAFAELLAAKAMDAAALWYALRALDSTATCTVVRQSQRSLGIVARALLQRRHPVDPRIQEQKIVQVSGGVDEQELRRRLAVLRRCLAARPVVTQPGTPPADESAAKPSESIDRWQQAEPWEWCAQARRASRQYAAGSAWIA